MNNNYDFIEDSESNLSIFQRNPKITKYAIILLFLILGISIFIGLFEIFYYNYTHLFYNIFNSLLRELYNIYTNKPIIFYLNIYLLQIIIISCILPVYLIFNISISFIIKNEFKSFLILYSSLILANNFIFLLCNYGFKNYFHKKIFKKNKLMKQLKIEFKKNQFKFSCLLRFIIMPIGLKDYILSAFEIKYYNYILSSMIVNFISVLNYSLIGNSIYNIKEFFDKKKNWNHKSKIEKFSIIVSFSLIFITFVIIIILSKWVKKKYEEIEESIMRDSELPYPEENKKLI